MYGGVEQALRSLCVHEPIAPNFCFEGDQTLMPKRTWQPKRIPRRRKHGFLSRMATSKGQLVLKARRLKGRWKLTVSDERRHVPRGHR